MGIGRYRSPLARLKRKLGIEVLWLFILAELKTEDKYPYGLISTIWKKYEIKPGKVLPYVVLKRLESEGYVTSYRDDGRHYYSITNKGR